MPIQIGANVRRIQQEEFGAISFEVMSHVFAIHGELGPNFNEAIYKRELFNRVAEARLEVPIDISIGTRTKRLFLDVLVGDGAIFEFKSVDKLADRHRSQLLQYLMLCDLSHGKLINVGVDRVQHEFVNTKWTTDERKRFQVRRARWNGSSPSLNEISESAVEVVREIGTRLDTATYVDLIKSGDEDRQVSIGGRVIGTQPIHMAAPNIALKVTTFESPTSAFEKNAKNWLRHVDVESLAWINVGPAELTFTLLDNSTRSLQIPS